MNRYNPNKHHRRSIRLKGYNYSQDGAYFVTICTQNRECLLGEIENSIFNPNRSGKMISTSMNEIPVFYKGIELGEFVVMPNHVHAIIINATVGATPCGCPDNGKSEMSYDAISETKHGTYITVSRNMPICPVIGQPRGVAPTLALSLPDVVHRFKTITTKRYTDGVKNESWKPFDKRLWQRNYYEHIIRNDDEYTRIAEYIANNPKTWEGDKLWIK